MHLDESCLGNGREGENPGGYGGLIEARTRSGIQRRDLFGHAAGTTNNRMALIGASTALQVLGGKGSRMQVLIVSDSEYLVKGMRLWAPGWEAAGMEAHRRSDRESSTLAGSGRPVTQTRCAMDLGSGPRRASEERVRQ